MVDQSRQNVIVVGGGYAGIAAVKQLARRIGHKYNVILITARPYFLHQLSLIRMTVSDVDDLDIKATIPYDKLIGITHKQGTVTSIEETDFGKGGHVVLADGERIPYAALLLSTGSSWPGPIDIGTTNGEIRANVKEWRVKYAKAKHIVVIGGGAVGIETIGEIKDAYPNTQVTLIHSHAQPLSSAYPDKLRRLLAQKAVERGANLIMDDRVDQLPQPGQAVDITTCNGQQIKGVDLVIPAYGSRPNTAFIKSLGSGILNHRGFVKVRPTLELRDHPGVFAAGDIIEWAEMRQAAKAPKHGRIAATNIVSFLNGRPQKAVYTGQVELILVPVGKKVGASYFGLLWGITVGNFLTSFLKGKKLLVPATRSKLNYK